MKQSQNSSFTIFGKLFFPCKNLDFNLTGNDRTLDRVSELRTHYPSKGSCSKVAISISTILTIRRIKVLGILFILIRIRNLGSISVNNGSASKSDLFLHFFCIKKYRSKKRFFYAYLGLLIRCTKQKLNLFVENYNIILIMVEFFFSEFPMTSHCKYSHFVNQPEYLVKYLKNARILNLWSRKILAKLLTEFLLFQSNGRKTVRITKLQC